MPCCSRVFDEIHANLGVGAAEVLLRHGDTVGSETMTRRALELCPDLALAWDNLGVALLNQDRLDETEAGLRQALMAKRPTASAPALPHANLSLVERRRAALSARRPSSPPR